MLIVEQLRKSYPSPEGTIAVLKGIDLTLAAGETLALMGESGSGKSTLLHLIAGLDQPDDGRVVLDGQLLSSLGDHQRAALRRARLGLVFQQFNLIPSLTVADNLAFQARLIGRYDRPWIGELTRRLGLEALTSRYPEQLSGGQQQRVAIGRALAARPALLLADEPTGNLDEATAAEVTALILDLVRLGGCACLIATHSQTLARQLDRVLVLTHGQISG